MWIYFDFCLLPGPPWPHRFSFIFPFSEWVIDTCAPECITRSEPDRTDSLVVIIFIHWTGFITWFHPYSWTGFMSKTSPPITSSTASLTECERTRDSDLAGCNGIQIHCRRCKTHLTLSHLQLLIGSTRPPTPQPLRCARAVRGVQTMTPLRESAAVFSRTAAPHNWNSIVHAVAYYASTPEQFRRCGYGCKCMYRCGLEVSVHGVSETESTCATSLYSATGYSGQYTVKSELSEKLYLPEHVLGHVNIWYIVYKT